MNTNNSNNNNNLIKRIGCRGGMVTGLVIDNRGNLFRFSEEARDSEGTLGPSSGVNPPGMNLATHLRLDYTLRMSGSLLPLRMSL